MKKVKPKVKPFEILIQLLKGTGTYKILLCYLVLFFIVSLVMLFVEPNIHTYPDAMWYCFVSSSTMGFGDFVAVSPIGRILTVILYVYTILVVAVVTAVTTNFFMKISKARVSGSLDNLMDKLENLPSLSKEELEELSKQIKEINKED